MKLKLLCSLFLFSIASPSFAWQSETCASNPDQPACAAVSANDLPEKFDFSSHNAKVVFGFGDDGCLLSSSVATVNGELKPNRGLPNKKPYDGECAYNDQLNNAKVIVKDYKTSLNGNDYIVRIFGVYAVKDVGIITSLNLFGHTHEWEHAILYIKNNEVEYVGSSQHTKVKIYKSQDVPHLLNQPNTFPLKYVMHQGTHNFSRYDGKKQDGQWVPRAADPTPQGAWFGEDNSVYLEYKAQPDSNSQASKYIDILTGWHKGGINLKTGNKDYINQWLPPSWKKDKVSFK